MIPFEELDYRPTPMGPLVLRRRWVAAAGRDVHEVLLGDEHLMSSLFVEGERALATLGLDGLEGADLQVLVEALAPVIEWHREGLTPLGTALADDPRCRMTQADFFAFLRRQTGPTWDAVLLDIDHAPDRWLSPGHADFYGVEALTRLRDRLKPGGVFAMWSDEAAPGPFLAVLEAVFRAVDGRTVAFPNPLTGEASACTIYRGWA